MLPDDPFEGIAPPPHPARIAVDVLVAAERARRLWRTEEAVAGSAAAEREALCEWLGGMLHRPPLASPTAVWAPMRALVDALWWDLADRTSDPLEPLALSPRILPSHPWGEGPDA